uniref:Uncharacterized protein n=1 Tax=Triticum urartu TaxID=4572 RepID=A0A8R7P3P5_TRIUA
QAHNSLSTSSGCPSSSSPLPTRGLAPPLPTLLSTSSPNRSLKCPSIRLSSACSLADPVLGVDEGRRGGTGLVSTRSAAMAIVHPKLRGPAPCLPLCLARPALGASARRRLSPPCACGCAVPGPAQVRQ